MGKYKISNLRKSYKDGGSKPPKFFVEEGDYCLEAGTCDVIEKDDGVNFNFIMIIKDGPDQQDGSSFKGKKLYHNIFIMSEEHDSFEQWGTIGPEQLADMFISFEIEPPKSDTAFNPEIFLGEQAWAHLKVKTFTKKDKSEGKGNEVSYWIKPDEDDE